MASLNFKMVSVDVETSNFKCGIDTIDDYVKNSYYPCLVQQAYTYSIFCDNIIVGYCQFLFRDIIITDFPEDIADYDSGVSDGNIPALHIRFLAIDERWQRRKIGTSVLNAMIKKISDLSLNWPIRVITIDARIDLVEWYERFGFRKMIGNKLGQDGVTVAMYCACNSFSEKLQDYENYYERG